MDVLCYYRRSMVDIEIRKFVSIIQLQSPNNYYKRSTRSANAIPATAISFRRAATAKPPNEAMMRIGIRIPYFRSWTWSNSCVARTAVKNSAYVFSPRKSSFEKLLLCQIFSHHGCSVLMADSHHLEDRLPSVSNSFPRPCINGSSCFR